MTTERKMRRDRCWQEFSGSLETVVADLTRAVQGLPEEFRASATFEIEGDDYDDGQSVYLKWDRPETDKEMAARIENEQRWAAAREERELREFKRLSAKFGGVSS